VALLDCLRQLGEHVEAAHPRFRIPYAIHKERIGQLSIRLQANTDSDWTKALKYLLIDLKWILAFCSAEHAAADPSSSSSP
jgi:beclin 1